VDLPAPILPSIETIWGNITKDGDYKIDIFYAPNQFLRTSNG